jgi:hypothetical protein
MLYFVMTAKKSTGMIIHSIRLPEKIWKIVRRLANNHYRSLNNQILKIFEDWLVEHGYMEDSDRSRFDN